MSGLAMAYRESGWVVFWLMVGMAVTVIFTATILYPEVQECMQVHRDLVTNNWGMPVCEGK